MASTDIQTVLERYGVFVWGLIILTSALQNPLNVTLDHMTWAADPTPALQLVGETASVAGESTYNSDLPAEFLTLSLSLLLSYCLGGSVVQNAKALLIDV